MTENTFSMVIITYYAFNVFCIVLELYFIFKNLLEPLTTPTALKIMDWQENRSRYEENTTARVVPDQCNRVVSASSTHKCIDEDFERTKETFAKGFGFGIIFVIMVYQAFVTFKVTSSASNAYLHAMKGFDVLRRHNFMHCKNKTERNFIHTLVFSYARNNPMIISAGGYFAVDKALIIAVLGNMVNFVVFVYQFKPDDAGDLEYAW